MRDRKVQEILKMLQEASVTLIGEGKVEKAKGVAIATTIIETEVKILENRKQEKFLKKIIREENTEAYREDLYG